MLTGVLNVYKEAGYTSHDVVAKLRGILHQKRIGHTGTLDPDAVGVLPVCLGKATKLVDTLAEGTKTYETVLLLGRETDTQDISGVILTEKPVTCTEEEIRGCLTEFTGELEQIPPMYSAKKQNGKRLYQLAREGIVVERKPARIRIDEITMLSCELPRVRLRITCSKGTYIRTLCHDIGQKLGCCGCMEQLVRTRVGRFVIEEAHTLEEIQKCAAGEEQNAAPGKELKAAALEDILLAPDTFFEDLPAVRAAAEDDRLLHNGNPLSRLPDDGSQLPWGAPDRARTRIRLYDSEGVFLGIYYYKPDRKAWYPELFFFGKEG